MGELRAAGDDAEFTRQSIILHNLRRVYDPELPEPDRLESLQIVQQLGGQSQANLQQLGQLLASRQTGDRLRMQVLGILAEQDYPGLAPHIVAALPQTQQAQTRDALLDWLVRHPQPEVLAEVVKMWAAEDTRSQPTAEVRYQQVVEAMTGQRWSEALLTSLNRQGFYARGSAMELLSQRMTATVLRDRLLAMQPGTEAVGVIQFFLRQMNYMPDTRAELLAAVMVVRQHRERVPDAAAMASQWRQLYGYEFNIRDFHLLSQLQRDPLRRLPSRAALLRQLVESLGSRSHTVRRNGAGQPAYEARFGVQADRLTMADVTLLHLVNEMLMRQRVRTALAITAQRDREDRTSQWGGLIRYDSGQAEAILYPPTGNSSDSHYQASDRLLRDSVDSLMRFHGHFSRESNGGNVGPDPRDLQEAAESNTYGLVLTSLGDGMYNATFYNPRGAVVSLGDFRFE